MGQVAGRPKCVRECVWDGVCKHVSRCAGVCQGHEGMRGVREGVREGFMRRSVKFMGVHEGGSMRDGLMGRCTIVVVVVI